MRTGHLKYNINEGLIIEVDYEVVNKEVRLKLVSPIKFEYSCSYNSAECNEEFDRGYAIFQMKNLIQKIFFIKKHKNEFELLISEYRKAEKDIKKYDGDTSLDLIGLFQSLMEEHVSGIGDVELFPFWIDPELLSDLLIAFNE